MTFWKLRVVLVCQALALSLVLNSLGQEQGKKYFCECSVNSQLYYLDLEFAEGEQIWVKHTSEGRRLFFSVTGPRPVTIDAFYSGIDTLGRKWVIKVLGESR